MSADKTAFPIREIVRYAEFRGGTKFYETRVLENSRGGAIVINRWGKIGQVGQIGVETYILSSLARNAAVAKFNAKEDKGYTVNFSSGTAEHKDEIEFRGRLMRIWPKIGAIALNHLIPGIDTKGVRDPEPEPTFKKDENGKWQADRPMPVPDKPIPPPEPTLKDRVERDPEWGSW